MRAKSFFGGIWVIAALAAAFSFSVTQASWADGDPGGGLGLARISYLSGDTLFNSADTDQWAALSPNFTLRDGDRLWAGDKSKIEVSLEGGDKAWVNYQSELDDTTLKKSKDGDVYQLALVSGEASFYVRKFRTPNSVFQVDAPHASAMAYGYAYFRMSVQSDGTTQVGVKSGTVSVEPEGGEAVTLHKGDLLEVYADGSLSQVGPLPAVDDWDDWVASRIGFYKKSYRSARYLPPDMRDYSSEFDTDGRWVDYPDYGWIWAPEVAVGWSPYSNGRWCWVNGDFVWLPYDPWYAPFHYGSWTFIAATGWCWVPPLPGAAFWTPGSVGWAWGPDSVYWVPLAPGEVYYGWGYYGPGSVNIINQTNINITNVYVNSRVTNAVVAVTKNNFASGKTARIVVRPNRDPFLVKGAGGARVIGAPPVKEIKPTKAMRLPRPGVKVAAHALPPRHVEQMKSFVQKRRPVIGRKGSAFRPSAARPGGRPTPPKRERAAPPKAFRRAPGTRGPAGRAPAPKIHRPPPPGRNRGARKPRPVIKRNMLERAAPGPRGRPETRRAPGGLERAAPGPRAPETRRAPGGLERAAPGPRAPETRRAPGGLERAAPGPRAQETRRAPAPRIHRPPPPGMERPRVAPRRAPAGKGPGAGKSKKAPGEKPKEER